MAKRGRDPKKPQAGAKQPAGQRPMSAQRRLAEERAAAAQARIATAEHKRRLWIVFGAVGTVVVIVLALVIVKVATNAGSPKSGKPASAAPVSLTQQLESVPVSVLNAVGVGTAAVTSGSSGFPTSISAPPLTSGGKPEVFYAGDEWCPYCATERWAMVVALGRFGTFSNLGETTSSPSDVDPSTATLTFHGATYTSQYLVFDAKELESNQVVNGGYASLDTPTAAEQSLLNTYDGPPYLSSAHSIPFIDFGGKYVLQGASYAPQVLQGMTQAQIAAALSDPSSPIAIGADGTANMLTAAICTITNGAPTAVCSAPGVTAAAAKLGARG